MRRIFKSGEWGEKVAADYLRREKHYRILGERVRVGRRDEVDLIARDGACLVFVEVKTRRSEVYGRPADSVEDWRAYYEASQAKAEAWLQRGDWRRAREELQRTLGICPQHVDGLVLEARTYLAEACAPSDRADDRRSSMSAALAALDRALEVDKESYAARADLGGGVVLTQIHELDYLYWLFGSISTVKAEGGHESATIYSILNEEQHPLARYNSRCSDGLERLLAKCLAKRPEERYQSIDAFLGTAEEWLARSQIGPTETDGEPQE